jgi:hypothetical protein
MSLEKNEDMKNIDREFQEKLAIFKKYKYLKRQEEELISKGKKLEWPPGIKEKFLDIEMILQNKERAKFG